MPLLSFGKEAPTEWMEHAFISSGGLSRECHCGRVHFDDNEESGDWDKGELEGLREKATKEPEKYIGGTGVTDATVNGQHYVIGCPCNGLRRYEDFLWDHRRHIAEYLAERAKDQKRAADLDHALVGDLASKVVI